MSPVNITLFSGGSALTLILRRSNLLIIYVRDFKRVHSRATMTPSLEKFSEPDCTLNSEKKRRYNLEDSVHAALEYSSMTFDQ